MENMLSEVLIELVHPGRRTYCGYREIPRVLGGLGISILSTPQGIIDDKTARKNKLGGEILCSVW
jgi:small subunit ribosomal protein S8